MKVLVCGGRDFANWRRLYDELDAIHAEHGIDLLISGAQRKLAKDGRTHVGADWFAILWALDRQIPFNGRPAKWNAQGIGAGFIRNGAMLCEHGLTSKDLVVAFPGGPGTADMKTRAKDFGVPVREVRS